ncbi:TIGR04222 domain-containing membrane protein [Actinokineospora sp. NBRC 105648]|uniref:TIGR04222 domain-containing membrane protein n=1 Tax=Actinokineospora sp. NBRC 105648 TaxID=3032206 RepID=UPI0024A39598|nr:TIGR04222 domain-containing membrane protein [Actinokineospora sp. NBRC 105648]GLZ36637.1 hypothetical protein Acsp05_02620 [Actinokineospora sp. NBRC 105648]
MVVTSVEPLPEELGFLVAGSGRAVEVAVVALIESGALRASRDGVLSAVSGVAPAATPLQEAVLRATPLTLRGVITETTGGVTAESLQDNLRSRGYVRRLAGRKSAPWARWVVLLGALATIIATARGAMAFEYAVVVLVVGAVLVTLAGFGRKPLSRKGREAVKRLDTTATTSNRLALVALYGLLGKVGQTHVWEIVGVEPATAATLQLSEERRRSRVAPFRRRGNYFGSGDGSSRRGGRRSGSWCGGSSSYGSSSCGSSSCSTSSCSSSSCSTSSCSSDSCGSSCGGGGD